MSDDIKKCNNCSYWVGIDNFADGVVRHGICHRYPMNGHSTKGKDDWCGEWTDRNVRNADNV